LDAWLDYDIILTNENVPFTKLKCIGLSKLLVAKYVENQNPITTSTGLVEALSL
jgi:hypothetical protein